jgi:ribosome-associated protein YbcJ (S4-like RNA binding protein)
MKTQEKFADAVDTQPRLMRMRAGRIRCLFVPVLVLLGCLLVSDAYPNSQSAQYKEYEVKAAFMYNFLKFVDWPEEKIARSGNQIVIGIIGEDPFGAAADIFKDKKVEEHNVVLRRFEGIEQLKKAAEKDKPANEKLEALKTCHLLFICPSEQKQAREIIDIVGKNDVLTVGDSAGFIESGGAINFFLEDNKIRFNINLTAAEKAGLKIRSQLLRLAKRVVKDGADITGLRDNSTPQEGK